MRLLIAMTTVLAVLAAPAITPAPGIAARAATLRDRPLEGFGADTIGGAGGDSYIVTSLANSGPGTFRDAVSASGRTVTFAVAGTIELENTLRVTGHHITIDASTAPTPGITITAAHPGVTGALLDLKGAHDIIVRHIRIIDAPDPGSGDNLRIWDEAYNIVIDHCSFRRAGDGNFDVYRDCHDITIQWSIIAETVKNSLIWTRLENISIHHNLFVQGDERNPQLDNVQSFDMVNNVVFGWLGNYATRTRNGSSGNIVKNYYVCGPGSDASDAIVISEDSGDVYLEGNILPPECHPTGTTQSRLYAPPVTEMSPEEALRAVLEEAGAHPRDSEDDDYVMSVAASPVQPTSWGRIKGMYLAG